MRSFAEILLWTLPDTSPSEREDYIRIRQADAPEETLQTDFPIWFSVILNCYIGSGLYTADDGLIMKFFFLVSVAFISLVFTSSVGLIIRDYVCFKVGFNATNSYELRPRNGRSASYVAQNWPGGSKHIETIRKKGLLVCILVGSTIQNIQRTSESKNFNGRMAHTSESNPRRGRHYR